MEPQGIHLSRRGAWAAWRNASARHRLCQLQPTATNCNELHILRSGQKPLSFTTQNAVTARTVSENSSRFYARRGNPSVAPKIGRPNKVWPPRHVLQLFSTPWGANSTVEQQQPPLPALHAIFSFCTWPATAWLHNEWIKLDGALWLLWLLKLYSAFLIGIAFANARSARCIFSIQFMLK